MVSIARRILRDSNSRNRVTVSEWRQVSLALFRARRHSLIAPQWLGGLYRLALELTEAGVEGAFVECGVYNGGSASILADVAARISNRQLWLFDSFAGLPKPTSEDGARATELEGKVVGNETDVRKLLSHTPLPMSRLHIKTGWFHETFDSVHIPAIALLHIDADWYESVKLCLNRFYDSMRPGGVVVLDDYIHWPGCEQAVQEFLAERHLNVQVKTNDEYFPPYFRVPS